MSNYFYFFIRSFCFFIISLSSFGCAQQKLDPIQIFASLTYYLDSQSKSTVEDVENTISFTDEQVNGLWEKAYYFIYHHPQYASHQQLQFETALKEYNEGKKYLLENENEAKKHFWYANEQMCSLWHEAVDLDFEKRKGSFDNNDEAPSVLTDLNCVVDDGFKGGSTLKNYIPTSIQKKMNPYLIPSNHVMKSVLDRLFSTRVTQEKKTLVQAGFKILDRRKRSYICLVSHPDLPGYLLKVYLDKDKREKYGRPSWEWLVKRCEGAEKIHAIIHKFSIKYFVCAKKWIYCLPKNPSPPASSKYTRHLAVLLVKDMQLVSEEENYAAWKNNIRKEHLDELYILVTRGKGSSYRPDNIPFTKKGTFAFIDTEYPDKGPDFDSIREFLNIEMRNYWDKIVANGGS